MKIFIVILITVVLSQCDASPVPGSTSTTTERNIFKKMFGDILEKYFSKDLEKSSPSKDTSVSTRSEIDDLLTAGLIRETDMKSSEEVKTPASSYSTTPKPRPQFRFFSSEEDISSSDFSKTMVDQYLGQGFGEVPYFPEHKPISEVTKKPLSSEDISLTGDHESLDEMIDSIFHESASDAPKESSLNSLTTTPTYSTTPEPSTLFKKKSSSSEDIELFAEDYKKIFREPTTFSLSFPPKTESKVITPSNSDPEPWLYSHDYTLPKISLPPIPYIHIPILQQHSELPDPSFLFINNHGIPPSSDNWPTHVIFPKEQITQYPHPQIPEEMPFPHQRTVVPTEQQYSFLPPGHSDLPSNHDADLFLPSVVDDDSHLPVFFPFSLSPDHSREGGVVYIPDDDVYNIQDNEPKPKPSVEDLIRILTHYHL